MVFLGLFNLLIVCLSSYKQTALIIMCFSFLRRFEEKVSCNDVALPSRLSLVVEPQLIDVDFIAISVSSEHYWSCV
jgi:hypothetical protein